MNVEELAGEVAKQHGFTKVFAGRVVRTVIETIREEVKAGRSVKIRKLGTFRARTFYGETRAKFEDSPKFFE